LHPQISVQHPSAVIEAQLFDNIIIIIRPMDLLQYLYLRMLHIE